ncbi:MAG: hypothetical protein AB7Q29_16360 [Vicinamibacterales bacterium]
MSLGTRTFRTFQMRPGSGFIASAYAVDGLARWVRRTRPHRVLEVGCGIGTLTSILIPLLDRIHGEGQYTHVGIESDPFCLEQLRVNLGQHREKVLIVDRYESIPTGLAPWDLLVVDGCGPYPEDGDAPLDHVLQQNRLYASDLALHGVVFVEKDRLRQREIIMSGLERRRVAYCHYQPSRGTPGYHI